MNNINSADMVQNNFYEKALSELNEYGEMISKAEKTAAQQLKEFKQLGGSDEDMMARQMRDDAELIGNIGQAVEYLKACVTRLSEGMTGEEDIRSTLQIIDSLLDVISDARQKIQNQELQRLANGYDESRVTAPVNRVKYIKKRIEKELTEKKQEEEQAQQSAPLADEEGFGGVFEDAGFGETGFSSPAYSPSVDSEDDDDFELELSAGPQWAEESADPYDSFDTSDMTSFIGTYTTNSSQSMPNSAPMPMERPAAPSVPYIPMPMPSAPSMPSVPKAAKSERVKVKVAKINKVDFSVLTDETVKPGKSSCVNVFMYTKSQRKIVDKALKQAEKRVEAVRSGSGVAVRQGSMVTVVLSSDDAVIENSAETRQWSGDALDFAFRFKVPEDYKKKQADFACEILFDGIHISRLYFTVKLNSAKLVPVRFVRKDSRKAFVSYSHKDKQRVVDQLAAIQSVAPKLRFWMDNQSMSAGDIWRNEIASAIRRADIFLLFWSINSKDSPEVEKEWRYALDLEKSKRRRRGGAGFISPVPLDSPSECPPPRELGDLHFGSPSFDSSIDNIDRINFDTTQKKPKNIKFIG